MTEEDTIEKGSTIFDHLNELKKRVGISLVFLTIGTIIAYFFVDVIFFLGL